VIVRKLKEGSKVELAHAKAGVNINLQCWKADCALVYISTKYQSIHPYSYLCLWGKKCIKLHKQAYKPNINQPMSAKLTISATSWRGDFQNYIKSPL